MSAPLLEIDDLCVRTVSSGTQLANQKPADEILNGVSLSVQDGELHALVGPSSADTSALASTLLGSPGYEVTSGRILFQGDDITTWGPDVRAKAGLFLAFPDPEAIAGVSVLGFLCQALSARTGIEQGVNDLRLSLIEWMEKLQMDASFIERPLNDGFSSSEKKLNEILQMAVLEPKLAVLDETGPDVDLTTLDTVANGVLTVRSEQPAFGTLAITNHHQLLDHLQPKLVHVLINGQIVTTGGCELAGQLENDGYESFR